MADQPQYPSYPGPEQPAQPPAPTQPPASPPGYQPPPPPDYSPPPSYGQAPSGPVSPGWGQPSEPAQPYASWWSRVGAALLDGLLTFAIIVVPLVVGLILAFKDAKTDSAGNITGGVAASGILILVATFLLYVGFDIWNRGVRVGSKGQSFGKQIVGIRIVKAADRQLLGGGGGFLRWVMSFVLNLISCVGLLDVLWPLWDDKNQTLHDKVVSSIAVRA